MNKTILAVDDSKTMRDMINFTLAEAGFKVLLAEDGNGALQVLAGNTVDLVITDVNMPGMNGIDLVKGIRADARLRALPVLILTTEAGEDVKQKGRAAAPAGSSSRSSRTSC
ncbi:response regulator [Hankyongella ginsenosidimutans]|uniref:response regulator n=1 Tax=Hankyongella ginsenosidimutans TaxID=1763828 RepID=UPI003CCC4B01